MTSEKLARVEIDRHLRVAGSAGQEADSIDPAAGPGIAAIEYPPTTGLADDLLFAGGKAIGVVEAKTKGYPLTGVGTRSVKSWSETNPDGRWRPYDSDDLLKRDRVCLDIFRLEEKSLEDSDRLPPPDELAQEIAANIQAAWKQFAAIAATINEQFLTLSTDLHHPLRKAVESPVS